MAIAFPQSCLIFLACFLSAHANKVIYMSDSARNCAGNVDATSEEGGLLYSQSNLLYSSDVDCTLTITAADNRQVAANLAILNLPGTNSSSALCNDYLKIYDGASPQNGSLLTPVDGLCGTWTDSLDALVYSSNSNKMTIQFHSNFDEIVGDGFLLVYVAFVPSRVTHTCERPGDFRCDNSMCIDSKYTCDGQRHCDGSDESSNEEGANCPLGKTWLPRQIKLSALLLYLDFLFAATSDFLGQILKLGNLSVASILGALFVLAVAVIVTISYFCTSDKCCQQTKTWYREKYVRYSEAVMGEVAGSGKYYKKQEPEARVKSPTKSRFILRKQSASFGPNSGSRDGNTGGGEFREYYHLTTTFAVNPESLKQLGTKLDTDGRPTTEV